MARRTRMQPPARRRAEETVEQVVCGRLNSTVNQMLTISMRKLWIQQPQQSFAGAAFATHAHNQRRNETKREAKRHRCNLNEGEEHEELLQVGDKSTLEHDVPNVQVLGAVVPLSDTDFSDTDLLDQKVYYGK